MAKALMGYRTAYDHRLMLEAVELRRRVRDLEGLVERLQQDNDRLRADRPERPAADLRQPDDAGAPVPTIAG